MSHSEPNSQQPAEGVGAYQKRGSSQRTLVVTLAIAAVVALIAVVSVVLISVNTKPTPTGTLAVGLVLEPTNLNVRTTPGAALDQVLLDNVYQGLVTLKSGTLEVVPALATEYKVSDDGLTYTFTVNTNAEFSSGAKLSVADVTASLEETKPMLGDVKSVTSPDKKTVVIELNEPNSLLLFSLAGRAGIILEKEATNDLNTTANGTGPYELDSWNQGDSITLTAKQNYWGTPASLETAVFKYIPDPKAAVNATLDGDVDVQTAVNPELLSEFDSNESFTLERAASTDVFTLAYNNEKVPLNDVRVREALSRAVDQKALIEALQGDGLAIGSPVTKIETGYRDLTAVNDYDPESAKKLLADAGVTNLTLTMTIPNFYGTTIANLLVSQYKEIGVTLKIDMVEFATWLEQVYTNANYELSYIDHSEAGTIANYANPDYYFNYNSQEVQALFAEALAALDEQTYAAKIAQASEVIADDAVAKWLYNYTPTTALNSKVSGFPTSNTNSRINLEGVKVAE